jgi:N-acetyl-anhydromuramyl-L-alanine amidase AmpD
MVKEILINPIENCVKEKSNKKYLILLDTLRYDFKKYILSLSKKEYAPAFLIKKNGDIHKFYDESYYTNLTNIEKINKTAIFIGLENAGKLINMDGNYLNWCNDIVEKYDVEEIKINKEISYYDKYTKQQLQSLGQIIIHLGNKYNLNLKEISFKNKEDNAIIFLNDIDIFSYSPNPSLNVEKLNSIIFNS